MDEFFVFLIENNLITVAFIIGALVFVIAIIGSIKTIIEPSPTMRIVLAFFGLFLMVSSVAGYALERPGETEPAPTAVPIQTEEIDVAQPVSTSTNSSSPPVESSTLTREIDALAPIATLAPNNCSELIIGAQNPPSLGVDWKFEAISEDRIIHVWSNHRDPNLPEFKFFLPAGQSVSFRSGGGSVWIARPGCDGVADVEFQRDSFPEITIEQYQLYIELGQIP